MPGMEVSGAPVRIKIRASDNRAALIGGCPATR